MGQADKSIGAAHAHKWPGERFNVVWTFTLDAANGRYAFDQVPQQLLEDDTDTVI